MKSTRKKNQIMRKFKNAAFIMATQGMEVEDRHTIFVECVSEANTHFKTDVSKDPRKNDSPSVKRIRGDRQLKAQEIFVEKVVERYPQWFEGEKL